MQCFSVISEYTDMFLSTTKKQALHNSMHSEQSPVDSENYSCSKEVWVLSCELSGEVLVGLQSPGSVMSAAIQLIYLRETKNIKLQ